MRRAVVVVVLLSLFGCARNAIDPKRFSIHITSLYAPFSVGASYHYIGARAETLDYDFTNEIDTIDGVACATAHGVVRTKDGVTTTDFAEWLAQDRGGAVWLFAERVTRFRDGEPYATHEWRAGERGARPRLFMARRGPRSPLSVTTPAATYHDVIVVGRRTYAPGVGLVREVDGRGFLELTSIARAAYPTR